MGYYKYTPQDPLIPQTLYYSDTNHVRNHMIYSGEEYVDNLNFNTTSPIYNIASGDYAYIPLGNSEYYLKIYNDSGTVTACFHDILNNTDDSTTYTIQASTTVISTYGFDIIGLVYMNASEFILIYNWQSASTTRSITYFRGFVVTYVLGSAPTLTMTNADSTLAASLMGDYNSAAGSTYQGRLSLSDANDNGWRVGLSYIRKTITSANVCTQVHVADGFMAVYTTGNVISIAKTIATHYTLNPSVSTSKYRGWYGNSDGYGFWQIIGTSNRYFYGQYKNHAVATGGQAAVVLNLSTTTAFDIDLNPENAYNYELREIGRLTNDTHVFIKRCAEDRWQLMIYEITQNNTNNSMHAKQVGTMFFDIYDNDLNHAWLVRQNLFVIKSTEDRAAIYQIRKIEGFYKLKYLGSTNLLNYNLNLVEDHLVPVPMPLGLYSDRSSGITDRLPLMKVDSGSKLVRSLATPLSTGRDHLAATTVGNYALFGGGYIGGSYSAVVDAYNASLTRSTPTSLSTGRENLAAATVGSYALFAGGYITSTSAVVDAYNASLTRSIPTSLSTGRYNLAATTVGNYALFGGGLNSSEHIDVVDAYYISNTSLIAGGQ
mgnify:CR=1 FL=1